MIRVWRTATTLATKDLRLLMRDRLALFFVAGIPILYGLFFGAISGAFQSGDASLAIAIVDEDQSPWSNRFVEILKKESEKNEWRTSMTRREALDACRRGDLVAVIVLPRGFGENAGIFFQEAPTLLVAVDPSRNAEKGLVTGILMQAMGKLAADRLRDQTSMKQSLDESIRRLQSDTSMSLPSRLALIAALKSFRNFFDQLQQTSDENQTERGPDFEFVHIEQLEIARREQTDALGSPLSNVQTAWDISFPQATIWGILGCATTFAVSLVRERRQGSLLRLQVAPLRPPTIVAGKALACFVSVVAVITMMLVLGMALGMRPRRPLLLIPAMLATAFCFTGIMACIATIGKSEESVSGAAWGANIVMAMFGGGMIPLAFLPSWMQGIGYVDPVRWAILILEGAIWREFTWGEAAVPLAVLSSVGVVALALGGTILRRKL